MSRVNIQFQLYNQNQQDGINLASKPQIKWPTPVRYLMIIKKDLVFSECNVNLLCVCDIYIYIYIHTLTHIQIYIYIYIYRERERDLVGIWACQNKYVCVYVSVGGREREGRIFLDGRKTFSLVLNQRHTHSFHICMYMCLCERERKRGMDILGWSRNIFIGVESKIHPLIPYMYVYVSVWERERDGRIFLDGRETFSLVLNQRHTCGALMVFMNVSG